MSRFRPLMIYTNWLIRKGYVGFAFWPFIFIRNKELATADTLNHERIHLRQQIEMLVLPFYIWYFTEYMIRRFQYPTWALAYRNISFEREAFRNETDIGYLERRKFWTWWSYLSSKGNL